MVPLDATLLLADLALEVRLPDLARGLFESAKKSQPDSPAAETGLGTLALAGKNLNVTYAELLRRNELSSLAGDGDYDPVEEAMGPKAIFSFVPVTLANRRSVPTEGFPRPPSSRAMAC